MATDNERTLACDLSALDDPEWHAKQSGELFASFEAMDELDDGYAFRFPATPSWTKRIAAFVQGEQQCCPFFRFEIVVEPADGATWLRLRGDEQVKDFLADNLVDQLDATA